MYQGGREVRSQTDYIMGTYSCLFQNVAVQDTQHNTDHYLVLGCLLGANPATNSRYLWKSTCFSIRPPYNLNKLDRMFSESRGAIVKPPRQECHRQACISSDTWILINIMMEERHRKDQRTSWSLARVINAVLQGGCCRWAAESG